MFEGLKRVLFSDDKKPVYLSFVLQRDDCSRMLGDFAEKHLNTCTKLILVWKNGSEDIQIHTSNSLNDSEATGMLFQAFNIVGKTNGI